MQPAHHDPQLAFTVVVVVVLGRGGRRAVAGIDETQFRTPAGARPAGVSFFWTPDRSRAAQGARPERRAPMKITGAELITTAPRTPGHRHHRRHPRRRATCRSTTRCTTSRIRHVLARHEQGAGFIAQGMARATRPPGRLLRHLGPRRHQPADGDRRREARLDPARRHHRAGAARDDRHRRLPGDRHLRAHRSDHQAQLPGALGGRAARGHSRRLSHRRLRAAGAGRRRRAEGRAERDRSSSTTLPEPGGADPPPRCPRRRRRRAPPR